MYRLHGNRRFKSFTWHLSKLYLKKSLSKWLRRITVRVQPPNDKDRFIGKKASMKLIREYIGNHRLIFEDGTETTIQKYLEETTFFTYQNNYQFLTLFPYEMHDLALKYIEDFHRRKKK